MANLFSMQGRLNRARYFWSVLGIAVVSLVLFRIAIEFSLAIRASGGNKDAVALPWRIVVLGGLIIHAFQAVKRLHDLNRPGSHYWLFLIPLYNIYLGLVLAFTKGTDGTNKYGPDPLRYQKVLASGGSEVFSCDLCNSSFPSSRDALQHICSEHGMPKSEAKEYIRREEVSQNSKDSSVQAISSGTRDAVTLADANQFLRYRATSREKVDAQAALMDGLLTRPDTPLVKAVLLQSTDSTDEFPWLIVKSGTRENIADMRAYTGFDATFRSLFGDQPFSIVWADHIAENCPGPGEAVTPLGRERYAQIAQDIREGKYIVDRHLGTAKS